MRLQSEKMRVGESLDPLYVAITSLVLGVVVFFPLAMRLYSWGWVRNQSHPALYALASFRSQSEGFEEISKTVAKAMGVLQEVAHGVGGHGSRR